MVVRAYTVCIGVTLECRQTESEMIRDGWGHADKVDKAYHDTKCESSTVDTTVVPDTERSFIPPSSSSTNSWDFATQEFPLFWCWHLGKVDGTDVAAELEAAF